MSRRAFLKSFTALAGGIALPAIALPSPYGRGTEGEGEHVRLSEITSKTLQLSPLAGFQYHHGEALLPQHSVRPEPVEGPLQLVREADNRYDDRAVRVDWKGHKLGYIPRLDNAAVSQLLDRGERLEAVIAELAESRNPWERVGVEVRWFV